MSNTRQQDGVAVVYFLRHGASGPIKVGFATSRHSFKRRVECLQGGNPEELVVLAAVDVERQYARDVEGRVHRVFKAFRIRGEWFSPVPTLLWLAEALALGAMVDDAITCAVMRLSAERAAGVAA